MHGIPSARFLAARSLLMLLAGLILLPVAGCNVSFSCAPPGDHRRSQTWTWDLEDETEVAEHLERLQGMESALDGRGYRATPVTEQSSTVEAPGGGAAVTRIRTTSVYAGEEPGLQDVRISITSWDGLAPGDDREIVIVASARYGGDDETAWINFRSWVQSLVPIELDE